MWQAWATTSAPPAMPMPHWIGAKTSACGNSDAAVVAASRYRASPMAMGRMAASDLSSGTSRDLHHMRAFPARPSSSRLTRSVSLARKCGELAATALIKSRVQPLTPWADCLGSLRSTWSMAATSMWKWMGLEPRPGEKCGVLEGGL